MKVLKNNFNANVNIEACTKSYPRTIECDGCGSELEYDKSDMMMGEYGCMHLECPLCGNNNMLDDNENNITLTADNVEFPTHFHHTSKETGAVDICNNDEVKERINTAITYFRNNKDEFVWFSMRGTLCVTVFRFDGDEEYNVIVSNNYFETYIPFEKADY